MMFSLVVENGLVESGYTGSKRVGLITVTKTNLGGNMAISPAGGRFSNGTSIASFMQQQKKHDKNIIME